jgi:hypothetical protein
VGHDLIYSGSFLKVYEDKLLLIPKLNGKMDLKNNVRLERCHFQRHYCPLEEISA